MTDAAAPCCGVAEDVSCAFDFERLGWLLDDADPSEDVVPVPDDMGLNNSLQVAEKSPAADVLSPALRALTLPCAEMAGLLLETITPVQKHVPYQTSTARTLSLSALLLTT